MDRRIEKTSRRPLLIGAAAVGVVAIILVVFLTYDTSTSFTLDGQRIRTAEVSTGMYEDYIPLRASVDPEKTVYLDAIEGGRVEAILVEEGAFVEEGQPLVDLSNTSLQLDVIAREAEVSEQLNNLRNTQLAIEQNRLKLKGDLIEIDFQIVKLSRLVSRYEELEGNQFISKTEYEDSRDELEYWRSRRGITEQSQAQDEEIRLRHAGHPDFPPVDDPFIAFTNSAGFHLRGVTARARFRNCDIGAEFAAGIGLHIFLLLLRGGDFDHHVEVGAIRREDERRHRAFDLLLDGQHDGRTDVGPAHFLRCIQCP